MFLSTIVRKCRTTLHGLTQNKFRNWRRYHTRYWPTLYVIDKKGTIQYTRIGEGAYEQTEETIQRLLAEPA